MKHRFNFLIDMPVRNEWRNIDLLRTSVLNCFTAIFQDMDGCHAFAMIAGELLENAMKYGRWGDGASLLHLRVWGDHENAHVQVENPVERGSQTVSDLLETLEWLRTFRTSEEAYRARLIEVAASPRGVSKLGLARVCYEGNCVLHAEVLGDVLRVTSVMSF